MFKFNLGDEVTDVVTGRTGTIITRCEHLTGCNTYGMQRKHEPKEKIEGADWFDENRLKATGKKTKLPGVKNPDNGGPQHHPSVR
jgi:hypothetical protein